MTRTPDDSWDLASSVGATATMVAAARALASAAPDALIHDPFAAPLVRAVGIEFFTRMLDGDLDLSAFPNGSPERVQALIDSMAVRTRFFDDCCTAAAAAGVRQFVILASGLDSRAYRLDWPDGTVVYEIDQPDVVEFKSRALANLGAQPTADRRTVAIDLRDDWPSALRDAGFDAGVPTAWLAEGLLIYLPAEAQDRLFDQITELSVPGSAVATEYAPGIMDFDAEKAREMSESLRTQGLDLDMSSLVYAGQRSHVMEYLGSLRWHVTGVPRNDLLTQAGRPLPPVDDNDALGEIVYVSAQLS
ncbi:SAM-dependent methyltransferase [Mycolicibacterium confluentis]|uniref:S-adenosyl-L-methionine-dependent methyltransferase n=1 Tax=Mycolicibacterium confluentis TaxID=28047 RepID=A0A7I7Y0H3_9MYCO|nr:class I SAM-dependent methyltransferase [Mycolicibacterium confluentis]MCV7320136.1 class I SAM-dependent methyltransferase [Mycolicibacterium confluentis]ORV34666.1 SAM-dependent methyltransferase [Mycolicibacterium confluentis]BBZ35170.1 putative S-adenosyl-L-methionine-dependent methyltransferase [Mycolicibacterium confluentis]